MGFENFFVFPCNRMEDWKKKAFFLGKIRIPSGDKLECGSFIRKES